MEETEYDLPNYERKISRSELAEADRDKQIEVMRTWFSQNFEDPAERTPYESREGGYIWIWGGPYDAGEELGAEFGELVDDEVIEALTTELEASCWQWASTERPGDYDEFLVEDIAHIIKFYHNFASGILNIEGLLNTAVHVHIENCFFRLLFVNAITVMETFLSDAFINSVVPNGQLIRRFVENSPEFTSEKFSLSEVYKAAEEIEERVKTHLADMVWHKGISNNSPIRAE